jgi:hypothetical protein
MSDSLAALPDLDAIRSAVRAVCVNLPVLRVHLFGSHAAGRAHPGSDVDLLVEFQPGARVGLYELGAMREELAERLGCGIDLLTRNAVERSRNPIRRNAILEHLVLIYE